MANKRKTRVKGDYTWVGKRKIRDAMGKIHKVSKPSRIKPSKIKITIVNPPPKTVNKTIAQLKVGDLSRCRQSGRYDGVSIGRDSKGYFAATHRARSKSYETARKIPLKVLKWIKSTG